MRARNKLSVKKVASLTRPGVYSDGDGLYLRVRPCGSRSWLFIFHLDGRRREMGLGSDLDVSLAKARDKAASARALVLEGSDPQRARQAERAQVQAAAAPVITFGAFATDLVDSIEDGFKNAKHRQQWRNSLATHAASLLPLAIGEVGTDAIVAVLQPIWLAKAETASRVRGRIERVLDAAKAKGLRSGENPARWRGHLELLLPRQTQVKVKHHPALPFAQIGPFMTALRQRPATAARALEFIILTAARSGEVRGLKWGELDLAGKVWTVPADRMKAGVIHEVPLSDAALAILEAVRPDVVRPDAVVFKAPQGSALSDMSMTQLLRRMDRGDITVHGFRSTFRDWAGEATEHAREDAELALAHTVASATERAYRRGRALEKRRRLMDDWAAYCGMDAGRE